MNVKQLVSMMNMEDIEEPVKVVISAECEVILPNYSPFNPFHVAAYGNWKVKNFAVTGANSIEIAIAVTPCKPIIEE